MNAELAPAPKQQTKPMKHPTLIFREDGTETQVTFQPTGPFGARWSRDAETVASLIRAHLYEAGMIDRDTYENGGPFGIGGVKPDSFKNVPRRLVGTWDGHTLENYSLDVPALSAYLSVVGEVGPAEAEVFGGMLVDIEREYGSAGDPNLWATAARRFERGTPPLIIALHVGAATRTGVEQSELCEAFARHLRIKAKNAGAAVSEFFDELTRAEDQIGDAVYPVRDAQSETGFEDPESARSFFHEAAEALR